MQTGTTDNGDVELYWMAEGPDDAPAVVFVNGAGSSAVMWCRELIDPLLDAGYRVIRFDNRDIGRSTRLPSDVVYAIPDLAADLAAAMDAAGVERAHLLGRSMGGMTIMAFAAAWPERVRTMTLIYTTACLGDAAEHGLPGPQQKVLDAMADAAFAPPPADEADRIERRVADTELYAGTRYPFDEDWARAEATAEAHHAPHAEPGHGPAVMRSDSLVPVLGRLTQPTLVLHGTEDPIIDIAHGRFLDARLPNSALVEYEGLGHEMPPPFCTEIVGVVTELLAAH
jgi:pimeloyl-ACP methyl ester carboxylesterase